MPDIPAAFAQVDYRVGLDLHPINLADDNEYRWLQALIWPDHADRIALLANVRRVWLRQPPRVEQGDALEKLPSLIEAAPNDNGAMRLSLPRAQPVPGRRAGGVRIDPAIHVTAAARVPGVVGRRAVDRHPDRGRSIAHAALGIAERARALGGLAGRLRGNPGTSRTTATASFGLPASTAPIFQRYRHCGGGRPDAACGRQKPPGSLPARGFGQFDATRIPALKHASPSPRGLRRCRAFQCGGADDRPAGFAVVIDPVRPSCPRPHRIHRRTSRGC